VLLFRTGITRVTQMEQREIPGAFEQHIFQY
jgi:hypothetical protein